MEQVARLRFRLRASALTIKRETVALDDKELLALTIGSGSLTYAIAKAQLRAH